MEKLSTPRLEAVLREVPNTLRKLASERDYWKAQACTFARHVDAEKVASAMHDKGINLEIDLPILIGQLEKAAEEGQLAKIAEAVDLVGPNMGQKIASLLTHDGSDTPTAGASDFEKYVMGSIG